VLSSRDWVFGSRPRRLLLDATLRGRQPPLGWTKSALAERSGVSPNGGIDEHVRGLAMLGVLVETDGRWASAQVPLAAALRRVLQLLDEFDERPTQAAPRGQDLPARVVEARRALAALRRASTVLGAADLRHKEARKAAAALEEAEAALSRLASKLGRGQKR
jgi:hypothetical protein